MRTLAYMKVYASIKEEIFSGAYKEGEFLPTEIELEKMYQVSRTTVRKAMRLLAQEELVTIRQGYGTEVRSTKISQNMNWLHSVSESLEKRGYELGTKEMFIEQILADDDLAAQFRVAPSTPLVCIHRIQCANSAPVTIAKNYILPHLVPGIESADTKIVSLYKYLEQHYNIVYTSAHDMISASSATFEEAQILCIEPKAALLNIHRICYIDDMPAEVDFVKIIAEKYELEIYSGRMPQNQA